MLASSLPRRLNRFSNTSTVTLHNSQIRQSIDQNNAHKALSLFRQMKQNGVEPNNFTFPLISKACAKLSNLSYSQIIHTHVVKSPFYPHVVLQTALLDMYVKCGRLDLAYNVFVEMPERDVASWNAMLVGYAQSGVWDKAFGVFRAMRLEGFSPDSFTLVGVSQAISCGECLELELMKGIHSLGIRIGLDADVSVANTWISVYAKCGDPRFSELVFNGIDAGLRSLVSWNSLIAGYAKLSRCSDAWGSYINMLRNGFKPDISTLLSLLSSCARPEHLIQGMLLHSHGIRYGCHLDIHVVNTLISMYSKCGDVGSARFLFDTMQERSCVSWNAMISGYAEKGDMDEALNLFNTIEATNEKPDLVTVLSLISGCGQAGLLEVGRWIDAYADSNGLKHNTVVCNALIDMYAKCGTISDARELFRAMSNRTVVSWTTMISGCALNGLFAEALELFEDRVKLKLSPNRVTFLAVLHACTHGGFLDKGWEFFNMMSNVYRIKPDLDHYSCMVYLLGCKGKLKEALEFIQNIPVRPDAAIWSALLAACKIHNNVEIGEYAAHQLLELEPNEAVPYVEMANIYAKAGRWDGVARMRTMMKSNKVAKFPGQSQVEVDGRAHVFTVEGKGRHKDNMIYATLDCLMLQIKEEDPPDTCHLEEHESETEIIIGQGAEDWRWI